MRVLKVGMVLVLVLVTAGIAMAMATTPTTSTTKIQLTDLKSLQIEQTGLAEEYYVYENGEWVKKQRPSLWWMHVKLDGIKIYNSEVKPDYGSLVRAALAVKEVHNGGVFIDAKRGIVFAYVKDEEDGRKVLDMVKGRVKVILMKGDYTSEQLKSWKDALSMEIAKDEVLFGMWSGVYPDYTTNKVSIDFEKIDDEVIEKTMEILDRLKIPMNAVIIEKQPRPIPTSRQSYIRPLVGGIKIATPDNPYFGKCTLGFIAKRNGVRGFVTAGHCGNEGEKIYQPKKRSYYYVGRVDYDPPGPRTSDSCWVKIEGTSSDFRIYNQYNTATHFPVFSKMYSQSVGMRVCMGGAESGEKCGYIKEIHKDIPYDPKYGYGNVLYDQIKANYTSQEGDSGAPVYYDPLDSWIVNWCYSTYGVTCKDIYGIQWGSAYPYSYYSPISGVEDDLGYLDVDG